jgi:hypothetical protein
MASYLPSVSFTGIPTLAAASASQEGRGPVSDADITAGAPLRDKARAAVLAETTYSTKLIPVLTLATVPQASITAYSTFLTTELAWWNTNIELSPRQVAARQTSFEETVDTHHTTLNQQVLDAIPKLPLETAKDVLAKYPDESFVPTLQAKLTGIQDEKTAAASAATQAKLNVSVVDVGKQALGDAMKSIGSILYILLAIRFAAFAANDVLYKGLAYRILSFVYTAIFTPIVGWYYLYREIRAWLQPATFERPLFNCILPIYSYTLDEEGFVAGIEGEKRKPSFSEQWFGYLNSSAVQAWVIKKQQEEMRGRQAAL